MIQQFSSKWIQHRAEDAPRQEDAARRQGVFPHDQLGVIGQEEADPQTDELDQDQVQHAEGKFAPLKNVKVDQGLVRPARAFHKEEQGGQADQKENSDLNADPAHTAGGVDGKDEAHKADDQRQVSWDVKGEMFRRRRLSDGVNAQSQRDHQQGKQERENHPPPQGIDDQSAERRPHCWGDGGDERGNPHHEAHLVKGRLFQHDVVHQRQCDASADTLEQPAQHQNREIRRDHAHHRGGGKDADGKEEQPLHGKPLLQEGRQGDDHRQHQQVARGDPLHCRGIHPELLHQCGEGHRHGRFDDHAGKGHEPRGDDRQNQF